MGVQLQYTFRLATMIHCTLSTRLYLVVTLEHSGLADLIFPLQVPVFSKTTAASLLHLRSLLLPFMPLMQIYFITDEE
jgi:hypothetical protein